MPKAGETVIIVAATAAAQRVLNRTIAMMASIHPRFFCLAYNLKYCPIDCFQWGINGANTLCPLDDGAYRKKLNGAGGPIEHFPSGRHRGNGADCRHKRTPRV
jgi:hypothetical protein